MTSNKTDSKVDAVVAFEDKAIIPMALSEKCARITGRTADQCFEDMKAINETKGAIGLETLLKEWSVKWEVKKRQPWTLPGEGETIVAENGARITHKEQPKPEIHMTPAQLHTIMDEMGANVAGLRLDIETRDAIKQAKSWIKEQTRIRKEAKQVYDTAYEFITLAKKGYSDIAKNDPEWQEWRSKHTEAEWALKILTFEDACVAKFYPEKCNALHDADVTLQQADHEIEAAQVEIDNLSQKGGE